MAFHAHATTTLQGLLQSAEFKPPISLAKTYLLSQRKQNLASIAILMMVPFQYYLAYV